MCLNKIHSTSDRYAVARLVEALLNSYVADVASSKNEYQGYLLGGKDGRCIRLTTLPLSRVD